MSPLTLLGVVIAAQFLLTVRTAEPSPRSMFDTDFNPQLLDIQGGARHRSGTLQPQDLLVQFSILHHSTCSEIEKPYQTHKKTGWTIAPPLKQFSCKHYS
ncbi:hypothetical protein [Schlesneria sp. T3-172]|uniref:hypothetical protein n=1 Tax=Schlesneria sphaerica TaxID=3373610 RepID=UPI0037CC54A5